MSAIAEEPRKLLEKVANLRLPRSEDSRLRALMDRNTNGQLTAAERQDLESLVEWSEEISLLRAEALYLLGRKPV